MIKRINNIIKNLIKPEYEARLIERCKKLGKSQEYIKFCVLAFCKKFTKKQIADIMCIDVETVRKYKSIRRKELEK